MRLMLRPTRKAQDIKTLKKRPRAKVRTGGYVRRARAFGSPHPLACFRSADEVDDDMMAILEASRAKRDSMVI